MSLSCKITDYQTWGRYLGIYTVYRIDVSYKGEQWFVFRRHSAFMDLQMAFLNNPELKAEAEPLTELLPQKDVKSYFGSALATFESITKERMAKFSSYLSSLMEEKQLRKSSIFLSFLDTENKGISGIKRVLGSSQVLREEFAMCSQGRLASMGLNAWKRSYICLTKKGWLYMTACIYDTPDECDLKVDLKSKQTRIGGQASSAVVTIQYSDSVTLCIKFNDGTTFSSWLRQLSDFGINTAQRDATQERHVKKERRTSEPKTHIKAAGTGNTADEMSASYGI